MDWTENSTLQNARRFVLIAFFVQGWESASRPPDKTVGRAIAWVSLSRRCVSARNEKVYKMSER